MPSFDVVSELDKHEVTNAIDNAIRNWIDVTTCAAKAASSRRT